MKVFKQKVILLVEDEIATVITEQKNLEKYGYKVILAHSGKEAIKTLKLNPTIDLIIMDVDLGNGMDGTEAAEIILKEQDIPILFMFSHMEPELVQKTGNITTYGYILKNSGIPVIDASIKMAFKLFDAKKKLRVEKENLHAVNEQMEANYEQLKVSEQELRKSEDKFQALFERMPSGVAIYKAINNGEEFVFINFNRAGEQIEKVKREEIIGQPVTKVFKGVEKFGLLDVFKRVWKTGKPEKHPVSLYQDEKIRGWRENFVYKLPSGEIVTIYDDVTKLKQAEEALKQRLNELEIFNDVTIGRELKIIELKKEINELLNKMGKESKYKIPK